MVRTSYETECLLKAQIWTHVVQIIALMENCGEPREALARRIFLILGADNPALDFSEEFLRGDPTRNGKVTR